MLTACTAATSPSLYRVTELVPGISTRDDAIAKLGPPSSTSNIGNSTILQWGGNNSPVHLAISFGMDGRMIQAATDAQKLDQLSGATQWIHDQRPCDSQPQRHEKQTSSPGLILPDDDMGADGHAAIEVSDVVIH